MLMLGLALTPVRAAGFQIGLLLCHHRTEEAPSIPARMLKEIEPEGDFRLLALCAPSMRGGLAWLAPYERFCQFCEKAGLNRPHAPPEKTLLCSGGALEIDKIALFGPTTMMVRVDEAVKEACEKLVRAIRLDEPIEEAFREGFGVCGEEEWEAIWLSGCMLEARYSSVEREKVVFEEWIPPLSLFWGEGSKSGRACAGG